MELFCVVWCGVYLFLVSGERTRLYSDLVHALNLRNTILGKTFS